MDGRRQRNRIHPAILATAAAGMLAAAVTAAAVIMRPGSERVASPTDSTLTTSSPSPARLNGTPPDTSASADDGSRAASPPAAPARSPRAFSADAALADVERLESFGVRAGGTLAEKHAAEFLASQLRKAGARDVRIETFPLTNGTHSRNVIGRIPGRSGDTIILGAHLDSKAPSPGANDNGSGCGALLEIARCLKNDSAVPTVEIAFFGAEELIDEDPDHHHFGSRFRATSMTAAEKQATAGMISVDMIGYGPDFVVRTMGRGPQSMRDLLMREAEERDVPLSYLEDPGETGWSDHEAFELAGIPAAWIEWREDPVYHTSQDRASRISKAKLRGTGQFVLDVLGDLTEADLQQLRR